MFDRHQDLKTIRRCKRGEEAAFAEILGRYRGAIYNLCYRMTRNSEDARDLAQEVFIKVYTSLATFDPRFRFTTWMYRIASNCAIDHLRKKRPLTCSISATASETDDREFAGNEPTPHQVLRFREVEGRLEEAIQSLPSSYRQLILLRHQQHCRYDEIARITSLPIGTVKNRIFRAREILRVQLSDILKADVR